VVTETSSTGGMERLGLDYSTLRELNPRIIMASSSALGRTGPERERIAYGTLIQCFTGWASLAAHPGLPPRSAAGIWTDPLTATMETFLLLAAICREWQALCRLMGRNDLLADPSLAMAESRAERHAKLDEAIATWSRLRSATETAERLQALGIAATPTLTVADILHDEHLAARSFIAE